MCLHQIIDLFVARKIPITNWARKWLLGKKTSETKHEPPQLDTSTSEIIRTLKRLQALWSYIHSNIGPLQKSAVKNSIEENISSLYWVVRSIKDLKTISLSDRDKIVAKVIMDKVDIYLATAADCAKKQEITHAILEVNTAKQTMYDFSISYPKLAKKLFGSSQISSELSSITFEEVR